MNDLEGFGKGAMAVIGAIIGVAIVSVILSKKSDSPGFIQATTTALSKVINAAVTPVPAGTTAVSSGATTTGGIGTPDFLTGLLHFPMW